jgi:hypothetical protein
MTDSITAWATPVLAIVAVGGLGVGIWQALLTRKAVASALADVAESRHARIDASSPRVIVTHTTAPQYPAGFRQPDVSGSRWPLTAEVTHSTGRAQE